MAKKRDGRSLAIRRAKYIITRTDRNFFPPNFCITIFIDAQMSVRNENEKKIQSVGIIVITDENIIGIEKISLKSSLT